MFESKLFPCIPDLTLQIIALAFKGILFDNHLDGLRETHCLALERDGVFDEAIAGIRVAMVTGRSRSSKCQCLDLYGLTHTGSWPARRTSMSPTVPC